MALNWLELHPDKNRLPKAEVAFKIVSEVVSEEKEGKQERRWESVEHGRKQQATQRHNQDEGGEMMGGGSDGATGIGNCWPQLQTPHCGTERQDVQERNSGG
ncbi:uncharacterized protein LOC105913487 [Setaria italica]|uniref:uncharacterized protein LOC105913487 n=1 Tax=Setaria italica TaxID=4555 RepID=UPI0006484342|nr:uncharacterized protein LOC105913487 [Setaria italica]